MGLRHWLHGNTGARAAAPKKIKAPDFKARASEARSAHAAGRMDLRQAIQHMTGERSITFISAPDPDGFMPLVGFSSDILDQAIAASTWYYACVVANARAASDLPPVVQVKDENGEWQRDRAHPLNDLLSSPFGGAVGWPRWSWKQLTQTAFMQLPATGNAYLKPSVIPGARGETLGALFPLMSPGSVQAIENTTNDLRGPLLGWDLGNGTQLALDELVNVMSPTAGSLWDGIAPLTVVTDAIETDSTASSRQKWNMENRVSHGVIITVQDEWGMGATSTQEAKILAKLEEQYTASANDGKPIVIGGGAKIEPPPNSEELQVFDTRRFGRSEILAVCGTPPPMIGDYENATLQNFDRAFAAWWMNVLFPMNHDYYGAINSQAVWPVYGPDTRLWYDVSRTDIGVKLMDAKLDVAAKILALGHTANTAAAEVGLDLAFVEELETFHRDLSVAGREPDAVTNGQGGGE